MPSERRRGQADDGEDGDRVHHFTQHAGDDSRAGTIEGSRLTKPNAQTEWREQEGAIRALYESRDSDFKKVWCHRNMIVADESVKATSPGSAAMRNRRIEANTSEQIRPEAVPEQRSRR